MLPEKLAFVDIETTGTRASYDRIIEIGILRVENGVLTKSLNTLIDPQSHLPKEIQTLTGILPSDLENAPTFRSVMSEIQEILNDCIFVAHNVRFDYGFIKNEFKRHNISFSQKHFCTVRLSRLLYPAYARHNLDEIIHRFGFESTNRHRAFDDAKILFDFFKKVKKDFPEDTLSSAISKCLKKPSLPLNLPSEALENLPETPGVYIFYSDTGMPLYIGKSVNLRERILSHFSSDIHSPAEMNISQQVASIETHQTAGELGALLLESSLIKQYLPLYNKVSRIKKELIAAKSKLSPFGYNEVYLEPITELTVEDVYPQNNKGVPEKFLGFFKSKKQAKDYLSNIRKEYVLCDKLLGLEKTKGACFGYRLSQCQGACVNTEKPIRYNLRFSEAFSENAIKPWPFDGPITIEEKELNGKSDYFLVDKWCLMKKISVDEFDTIRDDPEKSSYFDLDVYKILLRYMRNNKNTKKIYRLNKYLAVKNNQN